MEKKKQAPTADVADFSQAQQRQNKTRVRLPLTVTYDGEELDELWMRPPTVLDAVVANRQGEHASERVLAMVAQCAGVDIDWLWEQHPKLTNRLIEKFNQLKDPVHEAQWDDLTLTLKQPFSASGKSQSTIRLRQPTTRDLMDESSNEKMHELVARLTGLSVRDLSDMDYLHDYSDLVQKINSFRNA